MVAALSLAAAASAATWYVDAAVASSGNGASWATAFKTIEAGLNAADSGDTVEVAGGTYAESLTTVSAGVTVVGSETEGKNGTVRVLGSAGSSVLTSAHQTVWRRMTFDGSQNAADKYVVTITGGAPTFEQCVIGPGQKLLNVGTGGATFSRTTIQEARRGDRVYSAVIQLNAGTGAPIVFDYCLLGDMEYGYINVVTASRIDFNNCLLAGFWGDMLYLNSSSDYVATVPNGVHLTNCLALGNGFAANAVIENQSAVAPVTLTNCLIQDKAPVDMTGVKYIGAVTEVSPLTPGSPKLTHGRRPALLNLGIDDAANVGFFAQVAALANSSYGMKMTSAVDAADATSGDWSTLQPLVNAGHEVAAHSARHVYLPENKLMQLTYSGSGTSAAVTIDGGGTGTPATSLAVSAVGDPVANFSLNLSAAATDTIGEVCTAINAKSGFNCELITIAGTTYTSAPVLARDLAQVAGVSIQNVTANLLRDDAQFFADEITAPKATIEANLSAAAGGGSYVCTSFVYPFLGEDATVRAAVAGAGYSAARSGYEGSSAMGGFYTGTTPGGYDALNIWAVQPGNVFGRNLDATTLARRVSAFLEWAKFNGAAISLFSHGANEYSLSEWSALLALIAADQDITVATLADIQAYLAANAQSVANLVYTRTVWPDIANYRPLAGSTLLAAGTAYATTRTDFGGQSVPAGTTPSVGLYQSGTASGALTPAPLLLLLLQ
ncbi:hypothetical protein [Solidesulfovibrio magneticus]|uniref:hypothetical protein n=1 Tax=Solidesulfovibrio magneticus TaxID=184917 RepID=UPI001E434937|nr:hypothetical protein [Solidesulfovibrio magneticus]